MLFPPEMAERLEDQVPDLQVPLDLSPVFVPTRRNSLTMASRGARSAEPLGSPSPICSQALSGGAR